MYEFERAFNHPDPVRVILECMAEGKDFPDYIMEALYTHYVCNNEMPYGTAKARTGDPQQWIYDRIERELEEIE